jgi:hypothetical protein
MGRVVDKEKLRADIIDRFKSLHKMAITNKARVEFIMTVSHMIPGNDDRKEGLESIGFKSLRHFIEDCEGLHLKAKEFMNLAFAFDRYLDHAFEVVNHLVNVEGWAEIVPLIPSEHGDKCGPKLKANGEAGNGRCDNVTPTDTERGNSKSYTLKRLARDAEQSPEVAEKYKAVKRGELSANQAAIALGWRLKTITVRKDVESAAQSLRRLFDSDEIEALKRAL